LEQAGPEVVRVLPQLITALNHPSPATRQATTKVIALGGAHAAAAVAPLILRLDDPVLDVRLWSAYALREIGGASVTALPRLVKALAEDPEPKMRVEAARTIAAIGPLAGGAADALVVACRDPQNDVRLWSLFALGEVNVKSEAVLATLKQYAAASDAGVAAEANKALAKLGEAHDEAAIANAPAAAPVLTPITAPIVYDGLALVLVDAHGAAVVAFGDESHEATNESMCDGVKYSFRYLAKGQSDATGGVGEAFSIQHVTNGFWVEDTSASHSSIDPGPMRVAWSQRGKGSAYVYWRPEELTVTFASALEFETLDLRRFLR
jgi:HEAT repeat protein